ncbi:hypothetical protein BDP27DRAFT_1432545 [Rhodocollybia butyracea]|uniref:Uncharacterized protein n=1 Tax=Rhodocollybia butyracea TaxID=206335 RepID=A0A9P5P5E3_9AGAR|nr:hypothetical protein BDP27DRAFT_1432545 [Rhodocollybia butyracea]
MPSYQSQYTAKEKPNKEHAESWDPPNRSDPTYPLAPCEICVEAKQDFSVKAAAGKGKARECTPFPTSTPNPNPNPSAPIGIAPDGGGISGFHNPSSAGVGIGEGLPQALPQRQRPPSPYSRALHSLHPPQ